MSESLNSNWQLLGTAAPLSLKPAIEQIHRGVQFISMVGKHYVKNEADDSHTNMEWLAAEEVLAGHWANSPKGRFRFAMRSKDLTLLMYNQDMTVVDNCPLQGLNNAQILDWVKIHLYQFDVDANAMKMDIHYDIPHHETDDGVSYSYAEPGLFEEMARHRANSDLILKHFATQYKTASAVCTWPHHFDHGAYIPMVFGEDGEHLKSFSIGMGIPDEASEEPYYYITTWSKAGDNIYEDLAPLPAGRWISSPFNGAVLKASEITAKATINEQVALVSAFLETGIQASLKLLGLQAD